VEEKVHPASVAANKKISDLNIPDKCVIAAVIRKGKILIPHGDTILLPSDEVIAIVHASQVGALANSLARGN
jgi:trk system potassium uptake protein TrkA